MVTIELTDAELRVVVVALMALELPQRPPLEQEERAAATGILQRILPLTGAGG